MTDQQLAEIEAAIRSVIPGIKDSSTVMVRITESDDVNGLQNSWTGPAQSLAVRINDRLRAEATPVRTPAQDEAGCPVGCTCRCFHALQAARPVHQAGCDTDHDN